MKRSKSKNSNPILILISTIIFFTAYLPYLPNAFAVTENISYIRQGCSGTLPADTCFGSLVAWEAAKQRNLMDLDQIEVAQIEGTWTVPDTLNTTLYLNGWTTDATHYIKIYTTPEARHNGKWDDTKYVLKNNGGGLSIMEEYVYIDGLQVEALVGGSGVSIASSISPSSEIKISNLIIRGASSVNGINYGATGILKAWNNIIYGVQHGIMLYPSVSGGTAYLYNNTIVNVSWSGIRNQVNLTDTVAKNNIVQNAMYDDYYGAFNLQSNYNISSDNTSTGGTSDKKNITTLSFADAVNKDFHLISTDTLAQGAGADLSADANLAFTSDIDGTLRTGSWDIGADEASLPAQLDTTAPSTPTNLAAAVISPTQINLSWTASTDNVGVTGYKIYKNSVLAQTIAGGAAVSYSDPGLIPNTLYTYTVTAYDAAWNESGQSISASATTQAQTSATGVIFEDNFDGHPDWTPTQNTTIECMSDGTGCAIPPPAGYSGYRITSEMSCSEPGKHTLMIDSNNFRGSSGKGLTYWNEPCPTPSMSWGSDGELVVLFPNGYNELYVRYYIKFQPGWIWNTGGASPGQKFLHLSHFGGGNNYQFFSNGSNRPLLFTKLSKYAGGATDIVYDSAYGYENNFDPSIATPPHATINNFYYPGGNYQGTGTDFSDAGMMGDGNWHSWEFYVKLNSAPGVADGVHKFWQDGVLIANVTDLAWSDAGSPASPRPLWNQVMIGGNNNNYYTGGEQWHSIDDFVISTNYIGPDYVIGGGNTIDTTAPSVPAGVSAVAVSSSQINLSWTASTDNVGVTGYKIYKNRVLAQTIAGGAVITYSDIGLIPNTLYTYTVTAYDAAGNESAQSQSVNATTLAPSVTGILFEDNFDGFTTGWTPIETGNKPYIVGGTPENPGRGEPAGWTGWIDQGPSETIAIVPGEGRGGTPGLKIGIPKNISGVHQQIGLVKWLGPVGYDEVYVRFYMKYDQNWRWGNGLNGSFSYHKLLRVWQNVTTEDILGTSGKAIDSELARGAMVFTTHENNWSDFSPFYLSAHLKNATDDTLGATRNLFYYPTDLSDTGGYIEKHFGNINSSGYWDTTQTWHSIEVHYKLATAWGANDGIFELWIDGVKQKDPTFSSDGIFGNPTAKVGNGINYIGLNDNGTGNAYFETTDITKYLWFDDVVISTSYIGSDYVIGGGQTDTIAPITIASPAGGTYSSTQTVALSANESAITYYTTDGATPTTASSIYTSPIPINANTTLKFFSKDTSGNVELVKTETYTINLQDTTAPSIPTGVSAAAVSSSQINLSWTASTDNVGVTGYKIYKNSVLAQTIAGGAVITYSDAGLIPSTLYTYTVTAIDAAGNESAQSQSVNATTLAPAVTGILFEDNFDGHADWSPSQDATIECLSNGTGCTPPPPAGYSAYRIAEKGTCAEAGKNTLNIDSTNYRGSVGKGLTYWNEPCLTLAGSWGSDGDLVVNFPIGYEELYVRYYIKFQPGWKWNLGSSPQQKFLHVSHFWGGNDFNWGTGAKNLNHPGFIPTLAKWNSGNADISYNASYRYETTYYPSGAIPPHTDINAFYFSTGNYGGTGTDFSDAGMMGDGNWHSFEFYVKLNSAPGVADGVHKFWQDGVLIANVTDLAWSDQGSPVSPRPLWNEVMIGGNTYNLYAGGEQWYALDDLVISTSYIGPNYVIGGGTTTDTTTPVTSASPAGGTYSSTQTVTLSANESAITYYTTDGGTPTMASPVYSAPITISTHTTLKFFSKDTVGNSELIKTEIYTINLQDTTAPSVPAGVSAVAVSSSQINLSWTASTDDVGVTGYKIYHNGVLAQTITGGAVITYSDAGLIPNTLYSYTVTAIDAAGNESAQSSPSVSATTLAPEVTGILFEDNFDGHADWSPTQPEWNNNIDCLSNGNGCTTPPPAGYSAYRIAMKGLCAEANKNTLNIDSTNFRGASGKGLTFWDEPCLTSASSWGSDGNLVVSFAEQNEVYVRFYIKFQPGYQWWSGISSPGHKFFRASHFWGGDDFWGWNWQAGSTQRPNLMVTLWKWNKGAADITSTISASYETNHTYGGNVVKHSYFGTGNYSGTGTDFGDSGMMGDENWHSWEFYVKLNSAPGVQDGIYRFWQDGALIGDVTNLAWSDTGSPDSPRPLWNQIMIGGNNYNLYTGGEQWYAIDDLVISTNYISPDYVIGGGTTTDTTAPVTSASPAGGTYSSTQTVALSANESAITYYTTDGGTPTTASSIYTSPIPINANTTLKFFSKDTAGNSELIKTEIYTINLQDTTAPSIPAGVSAAAVSSSQINLSWTASTDNVAVSGYYIERCLGVTCTNFTQIGTSPTTAFNDTELTANTTYRYQIKAFDTATAANVSSASEILNATTQTQIPSQPQVTGVSGTITNDSSITVTGSGFGVNGPAIQIFDNFESGTNGNNIKIGNGSATIGKWDLLSTGVNAPKYSNNNALSGTLAFRGDATKQYGTGPESISVAETDIPATSDIFISYWYYFPSTSEWPCYDYPTYTSCNNKIVWITGTNTTVDDRVIPVSMPTSKFENSDWALFGNGAINSSYFTPFDFSKGKWYRFWAYLHGEGNANDHEEFWVSSPSAEANISATRKINRFSQIWPSGFAGFKKVWVNAYQRWCNNCVESAPTFDDVYIATGLGARARIEIGDASTYSSSKNLSTATIISWSDTSISATLRQGSLANASTAYLYVIDSSGNVNANGYPITIDGNLDTTPAPFTFTAQTEAALNTEITSDPITVSGINAPANISTTNGSYSIDGGAYTSTASTVTNGQTVTIRQTSSNSYSTTTTATLDIGGVTGNFDVTTLAAPVVTGGQVPALNFSDIDSGPKNGNTDPLALGGGAIVTIWGNNLGSTQGLSKIYVGNVEAAAIYYWREADGQLPGGPADLKTYHHMQEIAFAIPSGATDGANTIKVRVGGVDSNTLPFTVRAGNIKFIKSTGVDAAGNGSWESPLKTLAFPFSGDFPTGTPGRMIEGDIYYSVGVGSTVGLKIGGNNPILGTAANPVSLIAYPNTKVALSSSVVNYGAVITNYYGTNDSRASKYVNLSKLSITARGNEPDCPNGIRTFQGNRLVGLEITGPTVYGGYGGAITGGGGGNGPGSGYNGGGGKYYGIYMHHYGYQSSIPGKNNYGWIFDYNSGTWTSPYPPYDGIGDACTNCATVDRFQHLYYISNRSPDPIDGYEIGWNNLVDNPILQGIHIYDMLPGIGGWNTPILIHHNVVKNQRGGAINVNYPLADTGPNTGTAAPVYIHDNLIINDKDNMNNGNALRIEGAASAKIYNNTIYGYRYINIIRPKTSDYRNNLMVEAVIPKDYTYYIYDTPTAHSNNLFYGTNSSSMPSWFSSAAGDLNVDPLFTNPAGYDFSLQKASPAINAGTDLTLALAPTDFFGQPRQTGKVSIGAIQSLSSVIKNTYYISPLGKDTNNGSSELPFATFTKAFSVMAEGDTLIVKDGTYNQSLKNPPSGTVDKYTTVKAENYYGAVIDGEGILDPALFIQNGRHHIQIEGFYFRNGITAGSAVVGKVGDTNGDIPKSTDGTSYITIVRNIFQGRDISESNQYSSLLTVSASNNILVEENIAFGKANKFNFQLFKSSDVTIRRNIARWDAVNTASQNSSQPSASFVFYDTSNSVMENNIAVDGVHTSPNMTAVFFIPGHYIGGSGNKVIGNISLNNLASSNFHFDPGADYRVDRTTPIRWDNTTYINNISWRDNNGYGAGFNIGQSGTGGPYSDNVLVSHNTSGGNADSRGLTLHHAVTNVVFKNNLVINNKIAANCSSSTLNLVNNLLYGNISNVSGSGCVNNVLNNITTNPNLKYLTRIEADSPAKGTADDGGDRGANILTRYENGILTDTNLWPFPNEAAAKKAMCDDIGETRGFCSTETLTKYIWEYLGNPIPCEIYGTCSTDTIPDPFVFTAQTGAALNTETTSNAITVSGINAPANISITNGTYSIDGGAYVNTTGTVNNGQTITVKQTSSALNSTTITVTLTIGGMTGSFNITTLADTTPPTGTISINSDAVYSSSTSVTLTLSAADTKSGMGTGAEMQFSNDTITWSTAESYAVSKVWTLSNGDGVKTMYAKFKDAAGNWMTDTLNDTIILDATTPPVTTASPTGGTYTAAQTITLACYDGAGSGCANTYYTTDGVTPTTASSRYSSPIQVTSNIILKHFSIDKAGNEEIVKTEIYTINLPDILVPTVPTNLAAEAISSSQINLSWTASTDDVGVTGYKLYRDGSLAPIIIGGTTSYNDTGLTAGTTYSYIVSAYDAAGNESAQSISVNSTTKIPAFPGAEGFGANSVGGRGGKVIKVRNLNDSGPGSFRDAVTATGARIVVFTVSGIINLQTDLYIGGESKAYLTIAGETSPGGILITGRPVTINTHDVIVRHIRFRLGPHGAINTNDLETFDTLKIYGNGRLDWNQNPTYNVIVDHSSISWGIDENFDMGMGSYNITVQWSIISEGLSHAGHPKGEHSKGLLYDSKNRGIQIPTVSIHHNYMAHNVGRNPELCCGPTYGGNTATPGTFDVVNNVVYNWYGGMALTSVGDEHVNWVHNYAKQGSGSNSYSYEVNNVTIGAPSPYIYVDGNIGSRRLSQTENQWFVGDFWYDKLLNEGYRSMTRWTAPSITTAAMSTDVANCILSAVGATAPARDGVDTRVINDFVNGTGSYKDSVAYPADYPTFSTPAPVTDVDNDGMSDSWETSQGLDISKDDSALDKDSDGYTNIEEYLHFLSDNSYAYNSQCMPNVNATVDTESPTKPVSLAATAINSTQINLSWDASSDNTKVLGYKIYRNGTQIATTADTTYPDKDLLPQTLYSYTVAAYDGSGNLSLQSDNASATTSSESVNIDLGLIGHWKFDEGSGIITIDNSGNSNNGTLTSGTAWTAGKISGGINLDGIDDYIDLAKRPTVKGLAQYSLSVWFYVTAMPLPGKAQTIWWESANTATTRLKLVIDNGKYSTANSLSFRYRDNDSAGSPVNINSGANTISAGSWYHAVIIFDSNSDTQKMYLNGVLAGSGTSVSTPVSDTIPFDNIFLGQEHNSGIEAFNGKIDEVRLYNKALNFSEISKLYNVSFSQDIDTTAPTVTEFLIPSTAASLTVNISMFNAADAVGVTGYMVTESSTAPLSTDTGWLAAAPASYVFTSAGTKTLYAWVKDAAGNVSNSLNRSITITLPTYTIGGTISGLIGTMTLQNNGVDNLNVSTNASFTFATGLNDSVNYAVTILTHPIGEICAVTNGSGTVASANVNSVSITCVDNLPPTGTILINNNAAYTKSMTVTLTLSATDNAGGIGMGQGAEMKFSNDNIAWSTAEPYSTTKTWTLTTGDGTKTVYVKFKDAADNWMTIAVSDTILMDATPPQAPKGIRVE